MGYETPKDTDRGAKSVELPLFPDHKENRRGGVRPVLGTYEHTLRIVMLSLQTKMN